MATPEAAPNNGEILKEIAEIKRMVFKRSPAKEKGFQDRLLSSPVLVTLFSALFGLLGTGLGALIQGREAAALEQRRFESALILDALKPQDEKERARRLIFLVDSGLVERLNKKGIEERAQEPEKLPRYPDPTDEDFANIARAMPADFSGSVFSVRLADLPAANRTALEQSLRPLFEGSLGRKLPQSFFQDNSQRTVGELWDLVSSGDVEIP